jgi:hypothetical protein
MSLTPLTRQQIAKMIAGHPQASLPRIFEAALSGYATRFDSEVQGPKDAVSWALDCCIELMNIENGEN